jgi:hypothetical protein
VRIVARMSRESFNAGIVLYCGEPSEMLDELFTQLVE